ncbi:MAG: hypothetical protein HYV60_09555 [Planctomycetia bacterium]|nr:hypothetical protein [Planctomycetia bacterium]
MDDKNTEIRFRREGGEAADCAPVTGGPHPRHDETNDFSRIANEQDIGLLAEFWDFLIHNKKWWLTPIVLILLLMGVLVMLSGTAAAPFIYTLW